MEYNSAQLARELMAAGLPVESTSSKGEMGFSRKLTAEEQAKAEAVKSAHAPAPELYGIATVEARLTTVEDRLKAR